MQYRWLFFPVVLLLLWGYTTQKLKNYSIFQGWRGNLLIFLGFLWINAWQFTYRLHLITSNTFAFKFLVWGGSLSLGLWATFLLFSLSLDLIVLLSRILRRSVLKEWPLSEARRNFISRQLPAGFAGISAVFSGFGLRQALAGPEVQEIEVPIHDLPEALVGLRIAQISDLHIGPTIHQDYVQNVVKRTLALGADLIAITGDLVDGLPEWLKEHTAPLAELKAPLGVFYVNGNHEYYWGAEAWIKQVRQFGWTPLINEGRVLEHRTCRFLIAGVTDTSAHQFIPEHQSSPLRAAETIPEHLPFRLLLAHRPDSCFEAEKVGFQLQLSGHTHAGQFFPWNLLVRLAHKYPQGMNQHGKLSLYVNAGTGYWGPAHRLGIPSEITLIRLAKAATNSSHA